MIVAAPAASPLGEISHRIAETIDHSLPAPWSVGLRNLGGADGVTATNQFEARSEPDGTTILLTSGAAAMAWVMGDPRVQFDVGHWMPVATLLSGGVVVSGSAARKRGSGWRLASRESRDMMAPARLGLYLLNCTVSAHLQTDDPLTALVSGEADAALLFGAGRGREMARAVENGARAEFSFGVLDSSGHLIRDPVLPEIPHLLEQVRGMPASSERDILARGWQSLAACLRLEAAALLPWLTPPGLVAWWRDAVTELSQQAVQDPGGAAESDARVTPWRTQPDQGFGIEALTLDNEAVLALRQWQANSAL